MTLECCKLVELNICEGAWSGCATGTDNQGRQGGVLNEEWSNFAVGEVGSERTECRKIYLEEDSVQGCLREKQGEIGQIGSSTKGLAHGGYVNSAGGLIFERVLVDVKSKFKKGIAHSSIRMCHLNEGICFRERGNRTNGLRGWHMSY